MGDRAETSARDTSSPPRFWWLKRLGGIFATFIVAVLLFNFWWVHEADRRFQATIDAIHARGEPAVPEDFDVSGVPDAQNGALSLQNAANLLSPGAPDALLNLQYTEGWATQAVKVALASNARSLELARQARSQPSVDWKIKLRPPVLMGGTNWSHLSSQRELVELLKVSVQYNHALGNDRETVEAIRDMLNQSHVLGRGPSVLTVHLVALGLEAMACDAVDRIAPDLHVEATQPTTMPTATRQQIRGLIADLSEDDQFSREAQRAWHGERMQVLDSTRYFFAGQGSPWMRPVRELDGLRAAENITRCAAAAAQANWPAAQSMLPPYRRPDYESQIVQLSTMISDMLYPGTAAAVELDFHALVERRGGALRLAVRLYRIDHSGAYPETLSELVPAYMPAVPADPYAADGRPMRYRAGAPFPAIYSVGRNGIDDGGTSLPNGNLNRWECADIVYPLERIPPATQPSSQTQDGK